jgi:hypothetical protein
VAATIAAVELLLLVLVGLAFGGKLFSDRVQTVTEAAVTKASAAPAQTGKEGRSAPAPALARSETSVLVLNGNGVTGAAAVGAERARRRGYLIAGTANAPRSDFPRSLVMYRARFEAEARRLAQDLRVRRVVPLDGMRIADLQGAHVAFIIGG